MGQWMLAVLMTGSTMLGSGASAGAQEFSIPVMVQTRPPIPGARFALDGAEFISNRHGLAVTTVASPGTYELAVISPSLEVEGASHSFSVWTGGERASSRPLEVSSFTLVEAGFDTTRDISFGFIDQRGVAIEPARVDAATIVESDGDNRYRITGGQPTPVIASRAVPTGIGVAVRPASYHLIEAVVDGRNVEKPESDIEVGVGSAVGIPVALSTETREGPAEPSASATQRSEETGGALPWGMAAILIGLLVVGGAWLWRAKLEGGGRQWPSLPASWESKMRPPSLRPESPGDANGRLPERAEKEGQLGAAHHLRVHMKSGRIIDGWAKPNSQVIDDQVLSLSRVESVYDHDGNEVVSLPMDAFLLRSQVARVEHIDDSTDPPPRMGPTADVVRLEENHVRKAKASGEEAVDLREASSKKVTKPGRSKGQSA